MDGGAAAFLVRLGLGDRVVGTSGTDFLADFTGPERARLDAVPVLDPRQGNAETVIAARPDLVVGVSPLSFGGFDGTPTPDQLAQAGIRSLAACKASGAGPVRDLSATTAFVTELGRVFVVPDRAATLNAQLAAAVPPASSDTASRPPVLALSGVPDPGQPYRTRGGQSLVNGIITLAGGTNIAEDLPSDFAALAVEQIVSRDPDVIVVISGIGPAPADTVVSAVRSDPALARTTAVRENRIVVVPQGTLLSPSVLNTDAVRDIAARLRR